MPRKYDTISIVIQRLAALQVRFYQTSSGNEPVREFLSQLSKDDKKVIGEDIKTVQFGYPIGMPLTRKFENSRKLEEIRCSISDKRIVRIIFFAEDGFIILLSAFVKKSQKTPPQEINLAEKRFREMHQTSDRRKRLPT
ncbi:MAG: type II toxin-antitoxin system RelE/ParE family toxin [Rickettsiales bacterium]|jgi:phage-related protein|nr:type II toxin-antitoxin system RelE/ParE family toxin [Rickettsiales bacterium]